MKPRVEKLVIKDVKLRTFITDDINRDHLVAHVYDVTYGQVKKNDTLVLLDESIIDIFKLYLSLDDLYTIFDTESFLLFFLLCLLLQKNWLI